MKKSALVIAARAISGLSGYLVLAVAANHLTPAQFAALSLLQTIIFLSQVVFDSGLTQLATRDTAGNPEWRQQASRFQNVRLTLHAALAICLLLIHATGLFPGQNLGLSLAAAMALLSNALVLDWLLFSRNEQRLWAVKALISACSNVLITAGLLMLSSRPEAVLTGIALTNLAGWFYLRSQDMAWPFRLTLPSAQEAKMSSQLALGAMLFHAAYNTPLLVATSMAQGKTGAAFAVLYRLFSAMTLFIPTLLEFAVAKEVATLKSGHGHSPLKVFSRLLAVSLLVCSPFLLLPSHHLYAVFSLAIDLGKFQISPDELNYIKMALLLFSVDFCSQRTAFVFDRRKLIIGSAAGGLVVAGTALALVLIASEAMTASTWFHPLFAYQVTSATLILIAMAQVPHRKTQR